MAKRINTNVVVRNAGVKWPNFEGREEQYNRKGARNFVAVIPDEDQAKDLMDQGWNVKIWKPEEGEPEYSLKINLKFDYRPAPKVVVVEGDNRRRVHEDEIGEFDYEAIDHVDVEFAPYNWHDRKGNSGVSAYARNLYIYLVTDPFADGFAPEDSDDEDVPF